MLMSDLLYLSFQTSGSAVIVLHTKTWTKVHSMILSQGRYIVTSLFSLYIQFRFQFLSQFSNQHFKQLWTVGLYMLFHYVIKYK